MHRRAYFIYALSAAIALCAGNGALGQEPALIINKDGLSPELQLGDVVQVTVSKDGASIVVGDKAYPRGYVALKRNGCFEVGVQQGLDSGILKESTPITGRDMVSGPAMEFAFEVSAEVEAGIQVCPKVEEPFVVEPVDDEDEDSPPEKNPPSSGDPGPPQPMVIVSVWASNRGGPGEIVSGVFEAYCLDVVRRAPTPKDRFKVKLEPEISLSSNLVDYLKDLGSTVEDQGIYDKFSRSGETQRCVWASFIGNHGFWYALVVEQYALLQAGFSLLEYQADQLRNLGAKVTLTLEPDPDLQKFGAELESRIQSEQLELELSCPFTVDKIRTQWTDRELSSIVRCLRDGGTKWACAAPVLQPAPSAQ